MYTRLSRSRRAADAETHLVVLALAIHRGGVAAPHRWCHRCFCTTAAS